MINLQSAIGRCSVEEKLTHRWEIRGGILKGVTFKMTFNNWISRKVNIILGRKNLLIIDTEVSRKL